jgi:TonB family protein
MLRWLRSYALSVGLHAAIGGLLLVVHVARPAPPPAVLTIEIVSAPARPAAPPAPPAVVTPTGADEPIISDAPRRGGASRGRPGARPALKVNAPILGEEESPTAFALSGLTASTGLPVLSADEASLLEGPGGVPGRGAGGTGGRGDGTGSGVASMKWPTPIDPPDKEKLPYPREAMRWRVHGHVEMKLLIGANGRVLDVEVVRGLGYGLDEVAAERVRRIRFHPGLDVDGRPIAMYVTWKYHFEMP